MDIVSYFGVAIVVIALAITIGTARKKAEKKSSGQDRMNFTLRPPRTLRIASISCTGIFGLVSVILLTLSDGIEDIPVLLLALSFTIFALFFLYYSYHWKLIVSEDELILTPLFGKKRKLYVGEITHFEIKNNNFTKVYKNEKKLFTAPGLTQGGSILVSYLIEKGVKAPVKIYG
jgi:type II secretory pathway component PulF